MYHRAWDMCGDCSGSSQHGADTEARDKCDYSPLERVAHEGHVELVQVLLEHGADANAQDNERCTSLYWASDWGEPVVVQVLLSHGADVTAQCKNKQTPLHRAKEEVARLLQHGADANALGHHESDTVAS
jgi:ankyrin repeat protein